ncbi:hypothetical protein LEP1GSC064_3323 [Leptospira kirschneri serovar Grippotyphosa str. Moskva]|nr:hypothetical protein LEP1GSC044_3922 [Leptospira kirschneri serovar Grippotyphosa str. RM52]EKP04445.1 hypothetical protein LEP1GSC018_0089 [Leptospira kirschneri str. 2008720114]EKQ84271.1 hypothetical protein LEP1GSC064_3323 [Leptospira kirschneri serovar Grippotyphosa str. Moskva]EKR06560.1 hypothetical protein LEP1GSC122_1241 [Leptospira kirschneri serovar Valbuzzi str. 200702274]EMN05679.1 hypothetical protein LEP1GSC046_1843 [Leptospira kirschneri serovar Bim str. 1051]EMN27498.1 hypo
MRFRTILKLICVRYFSKNSIYSYSPTWKNDCVFQSFM